MTEPLKIFTDLSVKYFIHEGLRYFILDEACIPGLDAAKDEKENYLSMTGEQRHNYVQAIVDDLGVDYESQEDIILNWDWVIPHLDMGFVSLAQPNQSVPPPVTQIKKPQPYQVA